MKTRDSFPHLPTARTHGRRGFSLVEMMVVVAALAAISGLGVVVMGKVREAVRYSKLEHDVNTMNDAVRAYRANGGNLPSTLSATDVLQRLKTRVEGDQAKQLVGIRGSFLDARVRGVLAASSDQPRAVWKPSLSRFVIDSTGEGFSSFLLDDAAAAADPGAENRATVMKFAKVSGWVWDHNAAATAITPAAPGDQSTNNTTPVVYGPTNPAPNPSNLQPPSFSLPSGLYSYAKFPMPVEIVNPNPAGSSKIYYSVDNGPWQEYTGPLTLPKEKLTTGVRAYVGSLNPEAWIDSGTQSETYKTIYFVGEAKGDFHDPTGDSSLVTKLKKGECDEKFEWGSAAKGVGEEKPNSLKFKKADKFRVLPEEEFELGEITYYNGSTYSGTNATTVQLRFNLDFDVPKTEQNFDFLLKLLSTPNQAWQTADQNADYVWIPQLTSKFSTTVQGQTFYLQLRFGSPKNNGYSLIDEFHVHEGKSATGKIYGKLTTTPIE